MPPTFPRNPLPNPKQSDDARRLAAGSNAPSTRWRACHAISERCRPGCEAPCPAPNAIGDLDRVARLLCRVEPHQRRLLWARACGVRWAELCRRARRSRTTLTRDHRLALRALAVAETAPDRAETPGLPGKTFRHSVQNRIFPIIQRQKYPLHHDNPFPMTLFARIRPATARPGAGAESS